MNKKILNDLAKNVSCPFTKPLMHLKNSGIEIYDPFLIEESSECFLQSNSHLPSNKTLFYHQKNSLDHTLNDSQTKPFAKSFEYASKVDLNTFSLKKLETKIIKKRKSSNQS